jgi:GNAT superfamily N-acetyltransferase
MAMHIRPGVPADRAFLEIMLREAAFPGDPSTSVDDVMARPDLAMTIPDFSRPGDLAFVAEVDGVHVGAAWCRCFTDREHSWGYLDDSTPELGIAVAEPFRGRGVGSALLDALIERARADGFGGLSLCTDGSHVHERGMYPRAGFVSVGTLDDAPDAVIMRLELTPVADPA